MFIMSMHFFQQEISGILKYKEISSNYIYRLCFKSHIFFGIVAIFVGPFQFLTNVKRTYLSLHRKMGYIYFISILISSVVGLGIAQYAMGGMISTVGFSILAIFWMSTVVLAMVSIRAGDITNHKKWMFISYGLTFASIPQRTLLLIPLLFNIEFISVYRVSAWLPWILNTIIAFYLFRKSELKIFNKKSKITN